MPVRSATKINEWLSGAIHARWRGTWPDLAYLDEGMVPASGNESRRESTGAEPPIVANQRWIEREGVST